MNLSRLLARTPLFSTPLGNILVILPVMPAVLNKKAVIAEIFGTAHHTIKTVRIFHCGCAGCHHQIVFIPKPQLVDVRGPPGAFDGFYRKPFFFRTGP